MRILRWLLRRPNYRCELWVWTPLLEQCGQPAIAGVVYFGERRLVCWWHVDPLDRGGKWSVLAFIARAFVPVPKETQR